MQDAYPQGAVCQAHKWAWWTMYKESNYPKLIACHKGWTSVQDAYPQGALRFNAGQMENNSAQDTHLQGAEGRLSFEHKELDRAWCNVPAHRGWVPALVLDPRSATVQNGMSFPGGNESPGSVLDTRSIAVHSPRFLFIVDVYQAPYGQNGHSGVLCNVQQRNCLPWTPWPGNCSYTLHLYPDKHHFWVKYLQCLFPPWTTAIVRASIRLCLCSPTLSTVTSKNPNHHRQW